MKIIQEREKCIGCGSCAVLCPSYWKMAEDGKSQLLGAQPDPETGNEILEVEKVGCNKEVTDVCPVQCIKISKQ